MRYQQPPKPQRRYATTCDFWADLDSCPKITPDDSALVLAGLRGAAIGRAGCLAEELDISDLLGARGLSDCSDEPHVFSQPGHVLDNRGDSFSHLEPVNPRAYKRKKRSPWAAAT